MTVHRLTAPLRDLSAPAPAYRGASRLFVRGLAVVYAIAFVSLGVQIAGLAGPEGILPFGAYLHRAFEIDGALALFRLPTLFWITSTDAALQGAAALGVFCAAMVVVGWGPQRAWLAALFVLYLSLYQAGQIFTSFQWDYLLLECGFLALLLRDPPARGVVLLLHLLLFRLRFESGLFKLASGDPSWRDFSALNHYFETQPLPHVGAWFAHQMPDALLRAGVGFTFFVELVVPWFIFLPRSFRLFAAATTILAQVLIVATSNHNFINLLTILLCLFLLDDRALAWVWRRPVERPSTHRTTAAALPSGAARVAFGLVAVAIVVLSGATFWSALTPRRVPGIVATLADVAIATGVGNVYHLFPTMQTERQELRIFGREKGGPWREYVFRYKPGAPERAPPFIVPHQPRLDWMMWFLPPQAARTGYWFDPLLQALRENRPAVTALFARNPFADGPPPAELKVVAYRYRFTSPAERTATGDWWKVEELGEYPDVPPRRP